VAKIILLNGPPAAGKTTVSELFIKEQEPAEWAYISHDDIRQLVKSGYRSADGMKSEWGEGTKKQWRVGAENCADLALNFQQAGISSVIDFYATQEEFKYWRELLKNVDFAHVILLPTADIDLVRNAERKFPSQLADKKIAESYEEFKSWMSDAKVKLIDNSSQTPGQTIAQLASFLEATDG
jgi:hypothetical protein